MAVIGIDLGTTNSLVAYWTDNGPQIIPNVFKKSLTPSVVSIDESGEVLVGEVAKERLVTHPDLTVANFKRFMGTEKTYGLGKYKFTPDELSSFVIRSLKADAEAFLGEEVVEAVISVPAYFNDIQRKATKRAAQLAGLKAERLISEPTAAAISYGIHHEKEETKFLVFDLGGGTFDVSILEMFEGVMEVKSIAGDNFLGGEDFTELLINYFIEQTGIDYSKVDSKTRSAIYKQAELCKYELGSNNVGKMSLTLCEETHEIRIDPSQFAKIANPLLLRLRQPIIRALKDAEFTPDDIDIIILIGGATRMHLIRSVVSKMFGKLPYSNINPDESVALGAAIQVALKQMNEALNELILTDVCPYSLGTSIVKAMDNGVYKSGYFLPIIERNTPIPVSRVERLTTTHDNQKQLRIQVYQGESPKVENNIKIGELYISISPAPAGTQFVDVRYTYDINGILEVEAEVVDTGEIKRIVIEKNPGSMTKEEIEKRLQELKNIKIHPRDKMENKLLLARVERIYEESLGKKRAFISDLLVNFESALSSQDERLIKKASENLKKLLEELESEY